MNSAVIHTLRTRSISQAKYQGQNQGQGEGQGQMNKIKTSDGQVYAILL